MALDTGRQGRANEEIDHEQNHCRPCTGDRAGAAGFAAGRPAKLAELAALAIASAVLWRAARRAYRELAALDDRTLKDIGLARGALASISQAVAEGQAAAVIAQFPWANSQRQHVTQR